MEHLDQYVQIVKNLSNLSIPKKFTIRYFLFADKPHNGVNGYSIDLGTYDSKNEAENAMNLLVVKSGHNKFYIVESGSWSALSNNLDHMKVNMGKLDENGATLFKNSYEQMVEKSDESDKYKMILDDHKDNPKIKMMLNLIRHCKLIKLKSQVQTRINDHRKTIGDIVIDETFKKDLKGILSALSEPEDLCDVFIGNHTNSSLEQDMDNYEENSESNE